MTWLECLELEAKKIVRHRKGELRFFVSERTGDNLSIIISAGKRWDFIVKAYEEED